jgi:UDP-N-acetyl-D-galactosamine dehydrogenase
MTKQHKDISEARVLVMGATFKENVSDIRNSKVADIVNELKQFSIAVDVIDPHADSDELKHEYNFELAAAPSGKYDAIIVAVNHKEYINYSEADFVKWIGDDGVLVDIKGIFRKKISKLSYWSL